MGDSSADNKKALDLAMEMLSRRELCSGELRQKLKARNFSEETIGATLQHLQQQNLQSDARCAEVLLREHVLRGHGQIRIKQDLARRGVDNDTIDSAFAGCEYDFRELAVETLEKRYGDTAPQDFKERGKRIAFLQRRGFVISDCQAAVNAND